MANNDVIEMEVQEQIAEATGNLNEVPEATVFGSEETPNIEIGSLADVVNSANEDSNTDTNEIKTEEAHKEETMADQVKETEGYTIGSAMEAQNELGSKENPCTDLSSAKEGMHIKFKCADCGVTVVKVLTKGANTTYCKKCMKKRLAAEQVKIDSEAVKEAAGTAKAEFAKAEEPKDAPKAAPKAEPKVEQKVNLKVSKEQKAKAKTAKVVKKAEKKAKEPSYSIFQHIADSCVEAGHRIAADACQLKANYDAFANAAASKRIVVLNNQIDLRAKNAETMQVKKADHLNTADKLREKWVMYGEQRKAEKAAKVTPATAQ